jgi:hypothetical protein
MLLSALTLFALASPVHAVPINVDFTALLDRPLAGSNTVTGTFWYDSNINQVIEPGGEVSSITRTGASINIGGQIYNFPGWQPERSPGDTFIAPHAHFGMIAGRYAGGDVFRYDALHALDSSGVSTNVSMYIGLVDPGENFFSKSPTMELPVLDLSRFSIRNFSVYDTDENQYRGSIISMTVTGAEPVDPPPVPEPSTLVVLSVLTLAGLARARSLRRQCQRAIDQTRRCGDEASAIRRSASCSRIATSSTHRVSTDCLVAVVLTIKAHAFPGKVPGETRDEFPRSSGGAPMSRLQDGLGMIEAA